MENLSPRPRTSQVNSPSDMTFDYYWALGAFYIIWLFPDLSFQLYSTASGQTLLADEPF